MEAGAGTSPGPAPGFLLSTLPVVKETRKGLAAFGHGRGDVERRIALGDPRLGPAVSINRFAARPAPRGSGCRWRSG